MEERWGTPALIRDLNRRIVLKTIENKGPISRAEIARRRGLSSPTVSAAVDYLLQQNLVSETGVGESSGGRRPKMLVFNPKVAHVLGINLGGSNLEVMVTDLGGNPVVRQVGPSVNTELGTNIAGEIGGLTRRVIREASSKAQIRVLAAGIAAPGVTDTESGVVSLAPVLGCERLPLKDLLTRELQMPVTVENDVNAAAYGEKLLGIGKTYNDFVFVYIGAGIGAGIVINGELYRGHKNFAGDIGYLVVDPSWVQKETPGFGCLESLASAATVVRNISATNDESLSSSPLESSDVCKLKEIFRLAAMGERRALNIITSASRFLAMGLSNLLWVLSPRSIILGGPMALAGETMLLEILREQLASISPYVPQMQLSQLGLEAGVLGAAALAADTVKEGLLYESY